MTLYSSPVQVPWERQPPSYALGSPDPTQGAARMGADIAVIGYGELVGQMTPPYQHAVPWLRGVRYTEEGPVLGPALSLAIAGKIHMMWGLEAGAEGEAWILTTVRDNTGVGDYSRIGRVTMDPTTLVVSVSWRPDFVSGTGELTMDLWMAQRRMIVATNIGSETNGKHERSLYLMDLDTGQLVVHAPLPLATSTGRLWARALSFHPDRQEVLLIGDRVTSGWDRPNFWTVPVAASTIGTAVRHVPPGLPSDYNDDIYSEGWVAQPISGSRWMIAGIYSLYEEYDSPVNDYWGSARLRNYTFSGASTITEQAAPLSETAFGFYSMTARAFDLATNGAMLVAGVFEITGHTISNGGVVVPPTGLGGVKHIEATDPGTILDSGVLSGTPDAIERDGTVNVVALGADRYLYLVGGAGITGPATGRQLSFEFVVYAAGPVQAQPFVPGMKGVAPEENRRVFRRVIG